MTSSIQYVNREIADKLHADKKPILGLLWHGRLLIAPYAWDYDVPHHYLISRHKDGEFIARVMRQLGAKTVRGSTENSNKNIDKGGASALRLMLRILKYGESVGLTPDGPRGPYHYLGIGTVTLARLSEAPVIPIAYSSTRHRILNTWDNFYLPLPFSRVYIVYGDAIKVPRVLDEFGAEKWRLYIETALNDVTHKADALIQAKDNKIKDLKSS